MKKIALLLGLFLCAFPAYADSIIGALPYNLTNGTTADASQVMADFNTIVTGANTNAAANGVNSSITQLEGLTSPITVSQGGTGTSSAFTTGSVIFQGSTSYAQNNSNLFWDNTDYRLGIGTSSPTTALVVIGTATATMFSGEGIGLTGIGPIQGSVQTLKGTWGSNATATWTANQIILQNSSGQPYIINSMSASVNTAHSTGTCGGIDSGSLASSTWYYVYDEEDVSTSTNCLGFSLSSTSPTLISGYTYSARVGSFYSDSSSNIRGFIQYGRKTQYVVGDNLSALPVIASGGAGSVTTPTWASYAWAAFAPATASSLQVLAIQHGGNCVIVAPNANYGGITSTTNAPPLDTCFAVSGGTVYTGVSGNISLESSNIYYAAQDGYAAIQGYEDNF